MSLKSANIKEKVKAVCFGLFFGLLLCEIVLRFYNPFPFTIKKGTLILPANQKKIFSNKWISKLDKEIHYSRNSLGFRGPELPADTTGMISIITIGGSTTECKFLSDCCTWPFLLYKKLQSQNSGIWLNNAGVDGHSTFGHLLLLNEYVLKLKPRFAIFLTGINDIELERPEEHDLMTEKKISTRSFKLFLKSLLNQTEIGRTAFGFYHVQIAYKKGLIHREVKLTDLVDHPLTDQVILNRLNSQEKYLSAYKQRIDSLVEKCKRAGIQPILVTQPSLFGSYIDSVTHVAVGEKWFSNTDSEDNCFLQEKILDSYNEILRSYATKIPVIDLADKMPKNSIYFYDFTHYTNIGAVKVAEILHHELQNILFSNNFLQ